MGYFAITSDVDDLVVAKTSESIFVRSRSSYCFFELELKNKIQQHMATGEYVVSVVIPGKVSGVKNAERVLQDSSFLPWYYSQKNLIQAGAGMRLKMNGYHTKIIISKVKAKYDKRNKVSQVEIRMNYNQDPQNPVDSLHTFFTFKFHGNVVSHRGSKFAESRYFDKKLCPKGDFFDNVILDKKLLDINRIYCWFIMPKGFLANDYTSFNHCSPRDVRLIEKEYNVLLNDKMFIKRFWNRFTDILQGRPQVINWRLEENQISFNKSQREVGKWDEVRLFVSCEGFALTTTFLLLTGLASLVGVFIAIFTF